MTRKEIAALRMEAATEHIEAAQRELDRACQALSALNGMRPEQIRVADLADEVKTQFYRLSAHSYERVKAAEKAELDREPEAGDEDRHKGCCDSVTRARFAAVRP